MSARAPARSPAGLASGWQTVAPEVHASSGVLEVNEALPDNDAGGTTRALIIDEGVRIDPDVEVGQTVLYGKYSGTEVTVEGDEYLILRESDILAIIG